MAKLITEESYEVLLEEKGKDMYVVGIFSSAEVKNNNGRVYDKDLLVREVTEVSKKVEKKCLWGELGHPPNPEINPEKIAIKIEALEWKGNDLYGKAKVVETPMGNIAKTLIKEGSLGISSRGLGTVGEDGKVNKDFTLLTWDLVTDPSNNPSWVNGVYEGKDFSSNREKELQKKVDELEAEKDADKEDELTMEDAQSKYFDYIKDKLNKIKENL